MRYLKTILIALLIVSVAMIDTPKAYAAYCSIGGFGRAGCVGFFTGQTGSTSGYIGNVMSGGLYADSATEFINIVRGNLYGADARNQMGGALVVDGMLGYGPFNTRDAGINKAKDNWSRFESLVRSYANTTKPAEYGVRWNVVRDPSRNSAYFGSINDMAFHEDSDGPSNVIEFYNNGRLFQVQRSCGNLVGELSPLPEPEDWRMDVSSTVSKNTAGPGKTVTFTHKVRNVGSTQSAVISGNVKWGSEGQNTGDVPGKDYSRRFDPGVSDERVFTVDFTIPLSAKDGWRYCQYVTADPRSDSNNTRIDSDGDNACVEVALWRMKGESSVDFGTRKPGQSVTFTHTVTNVGSATTPTVSGEVKWGPVGVLSGAVSPSRTYSKTFNENESVQRSYGYTIPTTAQDGDLYCQYINWDKTSPSDGSSGRSTEACVRVTSPSGPPPNETVEITPVVDDGPDIEPTETTTLNGRVIVSGFPNYTDWGYTEKSVRLDAQQVTASKTDDGIGSQSRTVYSCPSGYSPTGTYTSPPTCSKATYYCPHGVDVEQTNNCKHFYNGTGNDTKAKCEGNGHTWSNGSCYDTHPKSASTTYASPVSSTQYRYRCEDPTAGSWGSWGGSVPTTCKKQYTCPGGAKVSGTNSTSVWRTSKPTCDGWQCQYPSAQINQARQPTCEYRCQGGTGSRAYNNDGSSSSPCYVPPSFSLRCKWDSGQTVDETVRGDGVYCTSSVQRVGVTIGLNACATLTYDKPSGWNPSYPRPGYGLNRAGTTYGQWKEWGWRNPSSDSGCSRVVGKPTVKVMGGDVITGNAFANGTFCTPVSTGSIVGWPRSNSNNYDATYTQLAAYAPGEITGFPTSKISSNTNSLPPRSLAFANIPVSSGDRYGGNYNKSFCAYDHYGLRPTGMPSINLSTLNAPGQPSGSYDAGINTRPRIVNSPTIPNGKRIVVYLQGNVFIGGSGIRYNRTGWLSVQDIPAFKLVVYGGNIYIENTVTQLDGIYIAQPNAAGGGGNIYTCASSTGAYSTASGSPIYNNCQNKLTVNGAFIAKKVHLLRSFGTALRGETAEQFNYLPELWTTQWPRNATTTDQLKYDAIISLPPVL